jgi:hypothetical protein
MVKILALAIGVVGLASASATSADTLRDPVAGPGLLCFKYSTFRLLDGERVIAFSGGAVSLEITIDGPSGRYAIAEGEIFAPPAHLGRRVVRQAKTTVYAVPSREPLYAIYGRTSFAPEKDHLIVWLSGPALTGSIKDAAIYARFAVTDPGQTKCIHTFTYSWDAFLPPDE